MNKKKSFWKDQRGVFGYAYAFIVVVVMCLVIFGFIGILIANMATTFQTSLQPIQDMTKAQAKLIEDANISQSIQDSVDATVSLNQSNIQMFELLAGFMGIITIIILGIVYFLLTQKNVEANRSGLQ